MPSPEFPLDVLLVNVLLFEKYRRIPSYLFPLQLFLASVVVEEGYRRMPNPFILQILFKSVPLNDLFRNNPESQK